MATWTKTSDGWSVALLTPEEDKASAQARKDKNPIEAYFHVELNFVNGKPGSWTAHLGDRLGEEGERLWSILKGGGCWWCDKKAAKDTESR